MFCPESLLQVLNPYFLNQMPISTISFLRLYNKKGSLTRINKRFGELNLFLSWTVDIKKEAVKNNLF
ncbi:Imm39 family immunity protein [Treponema sp.]|uniref:Imm39 family immunity protein n=1 Tax=Treponema sp. TaxID=166 RepID=UPI003FD6FE53